MVSPRAARSTGAATFECAGSCHCAAVRVALRLSKPPSEIVVRTCPCSFCTRRATKMLSDPEGHATFTILQGCETEYAFGTGTCRMLICRTCGVFAGAIMAEGAGMLAVINVRGLAIDAFRDHVAEVVSFDGEPLDTRMARRRKNWMPAAMHYVPS